MSQHFDRIYNALQCHKTACPCHSRGTAHVKVHCPSHEDSEPSMSMSVINGRVLVHCHAGCSQDDVVKALREKGLWDADLGNDGRPKEATPIHTRYEIRNVLNEHIATHVRSDLGGKKRLWWELPDGSTGLRGHSVSSLPLFGSELLSAGEVGQGIVVTEGEKAAKALQEKGKRAVGTVCGASVTPDDEVLKVLVPHHVVLWPDSDIPGVEHMTRIGDALLRMEAKHVHIVDWRDAPHSGDAADYTGSDLDSLLLSATEYISGKTIEVNDPEPIPTMAVLGKQVLEDMQSEYKPPRISYGFEELDKATGGQRSKTMTVIGGRTSEGKSTLLMQFAECAALKGPALILSNEMGGRDFYIRALAYHANIPMQIFRDQEKIDDLELPQVYKAMAHLSSLPLAIYENIVTVDEVVEKIERVQKEMGPVSWVGIDWLQMFDSKVRGGRTEQLDAITRGIRRIASDYAIPVTLVVQYDKKTAFGEEAAVESVRGTALPGMLCDVFIMLNRKGEKGLSGYPVELKVGKNRQGPCIEKMPLWFDSVHVRFLKAIGKVEV